MPLPDEKALWDLALETERLQGIDAHLFTTMRIEDLEAAGDLEQTAIFHAVRDRIKQLRKPKRRLPQ